MVMCLKGYSVNSCGDKYLRIYMESIFASVSSLVIFAWFSSFLFFFQFDFFKSQDQYHDIKQIHVTFKKLHWLHDN